MGAVGVIILSLPSTTTSELPKTLNRLTAGKMFSVHQYQILVVSLMKAAAHPHCLSASFSLDELSCRNKSRKEELGPLSFSDHCIASTCQDNSH